MQPVKVQGPRGGKRQRRSCGLPVWMHCYSVICQYLENMEDTLSVLRQKGLGTPDDQAPPMQAGAGLEAFGNPHVMLQAIG